MESRSVVTPDRVELSYNVINPGRNRCMVLLHGAGSNHTVWRPIYDILKEYLNYSIIVPDMRGHGDSGTGRLKDFTLRRIAEDLKVIVDSENLKNIVLVGNSLGASVADEYMRMFPDDVHKSVLISLFCRNLLRFNRLFRMINMLCYSVIRLFPMRKRLNFQDYARMRKEKPWFFPIADVKGTHLHIYSLAVREVLKRPLYPERFGHSTLLLQGTEDILAKARKIRAAAGKNPNVSVRYINTDHLVINREPEKTADMILRFISEVE